MKHGALILALGGTAIALALAFAGSRDISDLRRFLAAIFFRESITEAQLKSAYARAVRGQGKVHVLIVPGHDTDSWGTEFRGVREADLTVELGEHLAEFLKTDPAFSVTLARDASGYHPALRASFTAERDATLKFITLQKRTMADLVQAGLVHPAHGVPHIGAAPEAALKLYGINRWVNGHGTHLVLHVHFNDTAARRTNAPGEYSGIAIYVPERQYSNAKASRAVAEAIFPELTRYYPASNLPREDAGIVDDQELIAVGAANSLDAAGLLIEYGYIYEPQFIRPEVRQRVIEELALQTANGLRRFFGAPSAPAQTTLLPYEWKNDFAKGARASVATLALQAALAREGFYPPPGHDRRACPLTGNYGFCTQAALRFFQAKYEIYGGDGSLVGPATRQRLNMLFSQWAADPKPTPSR